MKKNNIKEHESKYLHISYAFILIALVNLLIAYSLYSSFTDDNFLRFFGGFTLALITLVLMISDFLILFGDTKIQ